MVHSCKACNASKPIRFMKKESTRKPNERPMARPWSEVAEEKRRREEEELREEREAMEARAEDGKRRQRGIIIAS